MSDLRSLKFTTPVTVTSSNYPQEFLVYKTNIGDALNGGQCCLWTVPAGTTWITFEMWGGGGSSGNSCCCVQGDGGGSGAYAVKTVVNTTGLAGCQYTICAASTTGCSQSTVGCRGYTSWVTGYGLSNFCAEGGAQGCSDCWKYGSCYQCRTMYCCAQACGGDLNIAGVQGEAVQTQFCGMWGQAHAPFAAATGSGPNMGAHWCQWGGGQGWPCTMFPGGGGLPAIASANSCCYSAPGAGGLVSITYG